MGKKTVRCEICNRAIKDGDTVVFRHGELFHARCRDLPRPPANGDGSSRRARPARQR